jgi:hypothetical protein
MKIFDKAAYHYDGDFPDDISNDGAYVIGGMFLAWCAQHGLLSSEAVRDHARALEALAARSGRPGDLYRAMDGVLSTEELSPRGQAFAEAYFNLDSGAYLDDYLDLLADPYPSAYHVPDTWENYDTLAPRMGERFSSLFP